MPFCKDSQIGLHSSHQVPTVLLKVKNYPEGNQGESRSLTCVSTKSVTWSDIFKGNFKHEQVQ